MTSRLGLTKSSFVVEIGSNDGYLLRNFVGTGIRCLGVEPTASTASAARLLGVPTLEQFFDEALARGIVHDYGRADLVVAINVFAHVPYPREVLRGVHHLLSSRGVFSVEFPHLVALIQNVEFDTIYHEHFSYFSFTTVVEMMKECGLVVIDVQELPTHGGSLRVLAMRDDADSMVIQDSVNELVSREIAVGIKSKHFYSDFESKASRMKNELLEFLVEQRSNGKTVVGYGAAAKGNTLLNFAGVKKDLISVVADRNPAKIGKYLPGSRIPVVPESELSNLRPDYVVILPWNLKSEIGEQLQYIKEWSGRFVTAVPQLKIW